MNKLSRIIGVVLVIVFIFVVVYSVVSLGIGSCGPTVFHASALVLSKHVDSHGSGERHHSHYIVSTDAGTFECDNGIWLGVWNSDELYGRLEVGKRFNITTKGNRVVNIWFQEYPYVISVSPGSGVLEKPK